MKKIIYSLVIMIAAGSLFTSCVENTEPQGIKDLREAKADYLASLSKLREADAEKVKAEAAVKQAEAATEQAKAAQEQAKAEAAQIMKDLLAARTDYEKEVLNAKLDSLKAAAELAAIKAEGDLAQAQWDLEVALRRIASASFTLTPAEDSAITNAATNLNKAQKKYNEEFKKLNGLKRDLWIAEYDHAAGYDTIGDAIASTQLAEKYQDSVIKYEGIIQRNTEDIARLEKAKEGPDAVAEVLKTFADSIKSLQADSLAALTEKALYDASTLLEANRKYQEKIQAFWDDSIPAAPVYLFAEIDGTDTLPKTYPLSGTGGKHVYSDLDTLFAVYVNDLIEHDKSKKTAQAHGIYVKDKKTIEVGGKNFKGEQGQADLDTAVEILGTIVEALNRHLVVVNDSLNAKHLDTLQKNAAKADTAYWKAREALAVGFEGWDVAKDSLKKLKGVKDAKKAAYDSVKTAHKNDTANLKAKAENLAETYKNSLEDFNDAVIVFNAMVQASSRTPSAHTMNENDTTKLLTAVKAYGTAQKNYVGVEDSIIVGSKKIFFSAMDSVRNDLLTGKDGNIGSLVFNENSKLAFTVAIDTVTWLQTNAKPAAADFDKGVEAITKAANDTVSAFDAYTAYNSAAKKDYIDKVYKPFFGITTAIAANDTTKDLEKVDFTWSDKTFSFKEDGCIVKFAHGTSIGDSILPTNTLKIVLDGVDGQGYSAGTKFVNDSKIFKGDTLTLFAQAINANQLAEEAANFTFLKDQLDKITAQYKAIVKDLTDYNAQYAADKKATEDGEKVLYGGLNLTAYPRVSTLSASVVANGKWNFYGKQLEFANEVAPEYPDLVKATLAGNAELHARIVDLNVYVDTLNSVMAQWAQFDDPTNMGTVQNVNDIIQAIDGLIDGCKTNIADAQQMVDIFEKAVAMAEQGYDDYTIDVTKLKQQIALSESKLAQLEAVLEIRKAEYDAIIAEYGIKDAE